jgi:hypothetical protein
VTKHSLPAVVVEIGPGISLWKLSWASTHSKASYVGDKPVVLFNDRLLGIHDKKKKKKKKKKRRRNDKKRKEKMMIDSLELIYHSKTFTKVCWGRLTHPILIDCQFGYCQLKGVWSMQFQTYRGKIRD